MVKMTAGITRTKRIARTKSATTRTIFGVKIAENVSKMADSITANEVKLSATVATIVAIVRMKNPTSAALFLVTQ